MTRRKPEPVRDLRWICPCGCGLVLSTTDSSMEARLLANLGDEAIVRYRSDPPAAQHHAQRRETPEPSSPVFCPGCGITFTLDAYLAEFLHEYGGVPARCEGCRTQSHKPKLSLVP